MVDVARITDPSSRRIALVIFSLSIAALAPQSAFAEPPEIEANYVAGKEALKAQRLDDALQSFKTALKFSEGDEGRTWQMLLAVALTYKERSEPQHAIEYYRRFIKRTEGNLEMMPLKWKRRAELANNDLAVLEKQCETSHGFVSVKTSPPGAMIFVDGVQGGADHDALSPFGLILPAGTRTIRVELEGHSPWEKDVSVRPGGAHPLSFVLEPLSAPAEPPASSAVASDGGATRSETSAEADTLGSGVVMDQAVRSDDGPPLGALITFGVAGALGLSGVAMTVMASDRDNQLASLELQQTGISVAQGRETSSQWDALNTEMETFQLTATILYGVAGAAAVGGLIWMLLAEPDEVANAPTFGVTPGKSGAVGHASWRF